MTTEIKVSHVPEIDWLKGFAILSVICIHSNLYEGTLVHDFIVSRAVPIFLVLFGITSDLWWRAGGGSALITRARLGSYYRGRLSRLVVPLWGMLTGWWLAVLCLGRAPSLGLGWPEALASYAGFAPWIGTSWFVTVILELVLVMPLLIWLYERLGPTLLLPLMAILCAVSVWHFGEIILTAKSWFGDWAPEPGWFYFWIFSPRLFWHVTAGIFVSRHWAGRPPPAAVVAGLLLTAIGVAIATRVRDGTYGGAIRLQLVTYLCDVPLAIALLGLFRYLAPLPALTGFLAWCGRWSWGIYLAHLLVFEVVHLAGAAPETGTNFARGVYTLVLFAAGTLIAVAADLARRAANGAARALAGSAQSAAARKAR